MHFSNFYNQIIIKIYYEILDIKLYFKMRISMNRVDINKNLAQMLKGGVIEHVNHIKKLKQEVKMVKKTSDLNEIDRLIISEVSPQKIPLVFIRAPFITYIGNKVKCLCKVQNNIVAAKYKNILVTSFHPELTDNLEFHRYFLEM